MKPTQEQHSIISCDDNSIVVKAFAGAAKTSTLVSYAAARPKKKMIYLAFNNAVATEARARFPSNVTATTTHSHAYRAVGYPYREKLVGSLRERDLVQAISGMDYAKAAQVIRTINTFHASPSCSLEEFTAGTHPVYQAMVMQVWERMLDPHDDKVGMTHDGYLKLAHIKGVKFDSDAILLLDEAQDSNPVTLDMFASHSGGKIAVGDNHQQIYSFRGAVNALETLSESATPLLLSKSFRTPASAVPSVNAILKYLGEETPFMGGEHMGSGLVDTRQPHTILSRSNAGLFEAAIRSMQKGRTLNFVGGIQNYRFGKIMDAYSLSLGKTKDVRDPYLRSFKGWNDLSECAASSADPELEYLKKVVSEYGKEIPTLISRVESCTRTSEKEAHVTLTTAHKSKGIEWNQVILWDDFRTPDQVEADVQHNKKNASPINAINECNLLYVAMTRSRRDLSFCNHGILEWLEEQEKYPKRAPFINV